MSGVKAVVFDLDGVLIDTEAVWEEVRRAYVAEAGGAFRPDSQRRLMGMSTPEWARYLSVDLGVGRPVEVVANEVIDRMAARYRTALPLVPGAVAAVRRLGARYPLALASSSPRVLIDQVLDTAGLADAFRISLSTEQVAAGKPAPAVYLATADLLGLAAASCAAVEDSSNGLRAAAAAGFAVVAVPNPTYPPAPDALALADLVVTDLGALTADAVDALR